MSYTIETHKSSNKIILCMSGGLIKHFLAHHLKIEIKKSNGLTIKQFVASFGRKLCDITQVQCTEEQKNGKWWTQCSDKVGNNEAEWVAIDDVVI